MTAFCSDDCLAHFDELNGFQLEEESTFDYVEQSGFISDDTLCYAKERFCCDVHLDREPKLLSCKEIAFWRQLVFGEEPQLSWFQQTIQNIKHWWHDLKNPLCSKKQAQIWVRLAAIPK